MASLFCNIIVDDRQPQGAYTFVYEGQEALRLRMGKDCFILILLWQVSEVEFRPSNIEKSDEPCTQVVPASDPAR